MGIYSRDYADDGVRMSNDASQRSLAIPVLNVAANLPLGNCADKHFLAPVGSDRSEV
jgi:hypothetical protein